jgi:tetratricopeptide (TPR) repeat protein
LVSGAGGSGKTRLALELMRRMRARGWACALVAEGAENDAVQVQRSATPGARLLLVVDYSEARLGLERLLRGAARDEGLVRVLLLARQAGDWWDRLQGGESMVLNNLSACLWDLGKWEEALAVIEEAVAIRRALVDARPDAFLPDLAASLSNQTACLTALMRWEEALAAVEEAVTIYRALAEALPSAFADRYADMLDNQAATLTFLGREADAQAVRGKAVNVRNR